MRAESQTVLVAGSARPVRGRLHLFASARSEILVASSTGPAADHEALATLRSCAIELDARIHTDARSLATSIRCGIDTVVQGHIPSGTSVTGHSAIAAPSSITSPVRHPAIDLDHLRLADPDSHPRRLTDRQLTPTT